MKKLIIIFCIMSLFSGCSYNSTPQPVLSESQSSEISENIQEETPKPNQEVESKIEVSEEEIFQIENPDFRNTKWGMSIDEVKSSEKLNVVEEQKYLLIYQDTIVNLSTNVAFQFKNEELIAGMYQFTQQHSNNNLFYDDYKTLVETYTKKYGEPSESHEQWSDNLMKGDPSNIGTALAVGHVLFVTKWETDTTKIGIILNGDNYKVKLNVLYQPIDYISESNTDGI